MNKRLGTYIAQKFGDKAYKAYLPPLLPPNPAIDLNQLYPQLEQANKALVELNSVTQSIPNTQLFMYMYVRKEALLSSQIEGTQSSFTDLMLFENMQKPDVGIEDVEEVSNYVKALEYGLEQLRNGFPLSLRLLREIHGLLLSGHRGIGKTPGEFRKSQNWIGGTNPANARFVPPPYHEMTESLRNFEQFLHDDSLPLLIKAGVAHVQFETIHPFLDGNGRLGRLLITLLLCENKALNAPVLYASLYLKEHRDVYYDFLQRIRLEGVWEQWLDFFLESITVSAKQALESAHAINRIFAQDRVHIENLGRIRFSCIIIFEYLKKLPQVSVKLLSQELQLAEPTVRSALHAMVTCGVLQEITGRKRDKIYVYRAYLDILESGAQPFEK